MGLMPLNPRYVFAGLKLPYAILPALKVLPSVPTDATPVGTPPIYMSWLPANASASIAAGFGVFGGMGEKNIDTV